MSLLTSFKRNWKKLDKYTRWAFYIIVIGALVRFALASINYITGDPCWYVNVVRFISNYHKFPLFEPIGRAPFWPPPLLEVVGALFYQFFSVLGEAAAEFSLRLVSPICGTLMLAYVFLIGRRLFNTKVAFYSTLFLTFIPNHIYQSSMFFPDAMVGLLIVMSIYYALKDKVFLSGILMGLSFLTKYNALFAFPIPFFIIIINRKRAVKKLLTFSITSLAIGSFWLIRNYLLLGNPVYPLFNSLFIKSIGDSWGGKMYLINLVKPQSYLKLYLSFFGVPDGYFQNLFFLKIPFLKLFLALWFLGTFLFILPAIIGLFKIKFKNKSTLILALWLVPFIVFSFLTLTSMENARAFLSRYLIPIFPIIAILWAFGFSKILAVKKIKVFTILILISIIIGLVSVEFAKAIVVKNSWNFYKQDFEWVRKNTPKDAKLLVPGGNCYAYNFNRFTHNYLEPGFEEEPIKAIKDYNISYIWVNQKDTLYGFGPGRPAVYSEDFIKEIEDSFFLVYENKATHTKIYKINNFYDD